jgi:hypothetical protein
VCFSPTLFLSFFDFVVRRPLRLCHCFHKRAPNQYPCSTLPDSVKLIGK